MLSIVPHKVSLQKGEYSCCVVVFLYSKAYNQCYYVGREQEAFILNSESNEVDLEARENREELNKDD